MNDTKTTATYPVHLQHTHLIPSIQEREAGIQPVHESKLKRCGGVVYNPFKHWYLEGSERCLEGSVGGLKVL